jgi:hypothetical protein
MWVRRLAYDEAMASFERNIKSQTGRSVAAWAALASATGLERHGELVSWLKSEKALSHGDANHIAKRALAPASAGDPLDVLLSREHDLVRLDPAHDTHASGHRPDPEGSPPRRASFASGGFNAMFTHRVKLSSVEDLDAELLSWSQEAYDRAA